MTSDTTTSTKLCHICKASKPLKDFNANHKAKDKKQSRCRECQRDYKRKWHAANRESQNRNCKEYRANNIEQLKEKQAIFLNENRERINDRRRELVALNHEEHLRKQREYNAKQLAENPDLNRERHCIRRFGINLEEKQRIIDAQGGLCPILQVPFLSQHDECGDHKHNAEERGKLGALLGILSRIANSVLGAFKDDTQAMSKALLFIGKARSIVCIRSVVTGEPLTFDNKCRKTLTLIEEEQDGVCCISGDECKLFSAYDEYSGILIGFVSGHIKQALGQLHYSADALLNMIKYLGVYESSYKAWREGGRCD